jgi:hypothetical protein
MILCSIASILQFGACGNVSVRADIDQVRADDDSKRADNDSGRANDD